MTNVSIKALATEIKIPVKLLIKHFAAVGICKLETDYVTKQEKEILFNHLNNKSGMLEQLTLQRKTRSTLNIPRSGGKIKAVKIEFRKSRTYLKEQPLAISDVEKPFQEQMPFDKLEKMIEKSNNHTKKEILNNHPKSNKALQEAETATAKFQRKIEEVVLLKIEEEARRVADEARRIAAEQKNDWNELFLEEDPHDYHLTTSEHARQAEDENDRQLECDRRNRTAKLPRPRKNHKQHYESKAEREEARAVARSSKKRQFSLLQHSFNKPEHLVNREVIIGETLTVAELANKMAVKSSQVIKIMMKMGAMATINQIIDQETAQLVAEEMGHKVILRHANELEEAIMSDRDRGIIPESRAPIVTIMGHVDHGKTSLLDYIRSTKIAPGEAGGITQHIGAYHVETDKGMITFLDTPGHAAFTAMRARGAQATDIVVLVIAADDGVMPQTLEAIQHAKAAKVPIVVAVNKIDKSGFDAERVKNDLSKHGITPEEWGGENQFVYVSAKTGQGIEDLLTAILLQAEMLELTAIRNGMASGLVIESFLDKGRGPVATIIVREGTLKKGDIVLCGFEYGRVRAMKDELGREIFQAGPSLPVEILGLSGLPLSGDTVTVVRDEKKAREVALYRQGKYREVKLARQKTTNIDKMFAHLNQDEFDELNIILKADVKGSVEAIINYLTQISTNEVKIKIVSSGVGGITETDATLAAASNAILIGFNVRADNSARRVIERENIDLRYYSVIYNLIDEVKHTMKGMLIPEYKPKIIGMAEVRGIFKSPKFGEIAGCMVIDGIVKRNKPIRILRNNIIIYEGKLESLRHFKEDINEVHQGVECGIGLKNYNDVRTGDIIEIFEMVELKRDNLDPSY
ncbi:MAG: translation initiation factor IF-2 [Candidatus Dasytiphilus stammeri]